MNLKKLSVAMRRRITLYSVYDEKTLFMIFNLLGIRIVAIYSIAEQKEWTNTQILNSRDTIVTKNNF